MHIYVDETMQRDYMVAAAATAARHVEAARRALRQLVRKGQRRIHMVNESAALRRKTLGTLTDEGVIVDLYVAGAEYRTNIERRRACLERLVTDALAGGCTRLILESSPSQDARDRQTIIDTTRSLGPRRPLVYDHLSAYDEPMLWAPDAVAWAYARGGVWRDLTVPIVRNVITL